MIVLRREVQISFIRRIQSNSVNSNWRNIFVVRSCEHLTTLAEKKKRQTSSELVVGLFSRKKNNCILLHLACNHLESSDLPQIKFEHLHGQNCYKCQCEEIMRKEEESHHFEKMILNDSQKLTICFSIIIASEETKSLKGYTFLFVSGLFLYCNNYYSFMVASFLFLPV